MSNRRVRVFICFSIVTAFGAGPALGSAGWSLFGSSMIKTLTNENSKLKTKSNELSKKLETTEHQLKVLLAERDESLEAARQESEKLLMRSRKEYHEALEQAQSESLEILEKAREKSRLYRDTEMDKLHEELAQLSHEVCTRQSDLNRLKKSHDTLCEKLFGQAGLDDGGYYEQVDFHLRGQTKVYTLYRGELESGEFLHTSLYIMLLGKNDFRPDKDNSGVILKGIRSPEIFDNIYSYIVNRKKIPGISKLDPDTLSATADMARFLGLDVLGKKLNAYIKKETWAENSVRLNFDTVEVDFIRFFAGSYQVPVSKFKTVLVTIERDFLISKKPLSVREYSLLAGVVEENSETDTSIQFSKTVSEAEELVQILNLKTPGYGGVFSLATSSQLKVARALAYSEPDPTHGVLNHLDKPVFSDCEFDNTGLIYKSGRYHHKYSRSSYDASLKGEDDTGFRIVLLK